MLKKTLAVLFASLAITAATAPIAANAEPPGGHCNSNQPGCHHQ